MGWRRNSKWRLRSHKDNARAHFAYRVDLRAPELSKDDLRDIAHKCKYGLLPERTEKSKGLRKAYLVTVREKSYIVIYDHYINQLVTILFIKGGE